MTEIRHTAWYNLVIANIYAVGGQTAPFVIFLVSAALLSAVYFFGERR